MRKIEWNDLRCVITLINAILIICFNRSIAWFGIIVAVLGIVKDFTVDKKLNGAIMHGTTLLLNVYIIMGF